MHRDPLLRAISAAAALALMLPMAAAAQFDDDPPIEPFPDLETAVVLNTTTEASVNRRIDETAMTAHDAIRLRINDNKKQTGYTTDLQPDRTAVVVQARQFAEDGNDLVLINDGDSALAMGFVKSYPETSFIDLGQPVPCVDEQGRGDRTGECVGGDEALPFNYTAVPFQVEDPAYLAGVIAASASRNDRLGIISGMADCHECNRYIQGFILGAQSIQPDIEIEMAYLAGDDEALAFGDPTAAKTFARAFIDVYQPDVLLPVANDASIGMIEAAQEADILAIGTGVDVSDLHPELADTVLTSITRDVETAVRHSMNQFSTRELPRLDEMTFAGGYVDLTDEWRTESALPVDVTQRYEDARDALITGVVDACPSHCGQPFGPDGSEVTEAPTDDGTDAAAATEAPADG